MERGAAVCTDYTKTANATGALERGSCYMFLDEVVISVYAAGADARNAPEAQASLLRGISDVVMVVGQNWTASCDALASCQMIVKAVGGRLVQIPK